MPNRSKFLLTCIPPPPDCGQRVGSRHCHSPYIFFTVPFLMSRLIPVISAAKNAGRRRPVNAKIMPINGCGAALEYSSRAARQSHTDLLVQFEYFDLYKL